MQRNPNEGFKFLQMHIHKNVKQRSVKRIIKRKDINNFKKG